MEFFEAAKKVFNHDEGNISHPYRDSKGLWTIGRGHLIGERLESLVLTQDVIDLIFSIDLGKAIAAAKKIFNDFDCLEPARKMAIVSMIFTLGEFKFITQFQPTIAAIRAKDWDDVADRILKTKWANDIDPAHRTGFGRDDRVSYMFRTGEFHKEYNL